jgi:hypothetical protein
MDLSGGRFQASVVGESKLWSEGGKNYLFEIQLFGNTPHSAAPAYGQLVTKLKVQRKQSQGDTGLDL